MSAEMDIVNYIVVGMGLNINQSEFDDAIRNIAVSLKTYSGKNFDRKRIMAEILNRFEINYEKFKESGLGQFIPALKTNSVILGKRVRIFNINTSLEGKAIDIDLDGGLILELDNGEIKKIISGDVSLRGLYEYNNC
jgi:BirA family biotin operon repressor/biotin-[acetyl-CoA-carboxylase] ligase